MTHAPFFSPKKAASFQICVDWKTATDITTHVPTEIISLDLVSCQPITVIGELIERISFWHKIHLKLNQYL